MDDMIIIGSNSLKIVEFKENMKQIFDMTDLGILSSCLGIEVMHEATCTWLNQKSYIQTILHAFKMSECNLARTLMEAWLKFLKNGKEDEAIPSQFRSLIASLRYLLNTRPDITYSVNYLSLFMNKSNSEI